jgi:predicted Zn-ribbon and HTH transcriptional regulator
MKVSEVINTLKTEKALKRTPSGRPITDYALEAIDATLADQKNLEVECVSCRNCCIILSSLLVPSGCPNCGSKDLNINITKADII